MDVFPILLIVAVAIAVYLFSRRQSKSVAPEKPRNRAKKEPKQLTSSDESSSFRYFGHTVLYSSPSQGNRVVYHGRRGKEYTWHPSHRRVIVRDWWIKGDDYCVGPPHRADARYARDAHGSSERTALQEMLGTVVDSARGDCFDLTLGNVQYSLPAHRVFSTLDDVRRLIPPLNVPGAIVFNAPGMEPKEEPEDGSFPCPCGSGEAFSRCHGAGEEVDDAAGSHGGAVFDFAGKTVLFYDMSHGNQVEYYSMDGRCYLWYPGNKVIVESRWRLVGDKLWFKPVQNTYNPVTRERKRAGSWGRSRPVQELYSHGIDAVQGDVFSLSSQRIPGNLSAHPGFRCIEELRMDHGHP